jgi:hypothetical protein
MRESGDLFGKRGLAVSERVVRADGGDVELDVGVESRDARLLGEAGHRVVERLVDPRTAEIDRHATHVDCVRSAADPRAPLEQHEVDAGISQCVRQSQARPTGADDDHALGVAGQAARNGVIAVVVLGGLGGKDLTGQRPGKKRSRARCGRKPQELPPGPLAHCAFSR